MISSRMLHIFFSFKLIKFNKRKIAKIEIGCYVMNWREEPLTFPQECSNMCLALQMHKRSFQVPKNHNFAPKIFGIWRNGHCFFWDTTKMLFHYSLLLSIQHIIIHPNNWTLLSILINFLISHVTNPLHLRARSVLFVSKGDDLTHQHPLWSCLK